MKRKFNLNPNEWPAVERKRNRNDNKLVSEFNPGELRKWVELFDCIYKYSNKYSERNANEPNLGRHYLPYRLAFENPLGDANATYYSTYKKQ